MDSLINRAALTDEEILAAGGWFNRAVANVATEKTIRVTLEDVEATVVKAGQKLHDTIDDYNASARVGLQQLCVLCEAEAYSPQLGVVHLEDCAIKEYRAALVDFARMKAEVQERK